MNRIAASFPLAMHNRGRKMDVSSAAIRCFDWATTTISRAMQKSFWSIKYGSEPGFFDEARRVAEKEFWRKNACMRNRVPGGAKTTGRARVSNVTPENRRIQVRRIDAMGYRAKTGKMVDQASSALVVAFVLVTSGATRAGDRTLGEYLSSECVACHQLSGNYQGIPPIVGWPEQGFIEIMNEYRHKTRDNAVMQTIAGKFSDEEVAALAAYFGSIKIPATDAAATPAKPAARKKK
jgi:cytochrome c553